MSRLQLAFAKLLRKYLAMPRRSGLKTLEFLFDQFQEGCSLAITLVHAWGETHDAGMEWPFRQTLTLNTSKTGLGENRPATWTNVLAKDGGDQGPAATLGQSLVWNSRTRSHITQIGSRRFAILRLDDHESFSGCRSPSLEKAFTLLHY